jgi:hypothetical protein
MRLSTKKGIAHIPLRLNGGAQEIIRTKDTTNNIGGGVTQSAMPLVR